MSYTSKNQRDFDIVVWGASGFTGCLVVEHLLNVYGIGRELSWAMAGRDRTKLERVRVKLGADAAGIPILIGECDDAESLNAIASRARVVCTTVGPYLKYGEGMLAACVKNGADYCDLTGEVLFIRKMIDAYEREARNTGARIVNSCGFDSLPSDLGTFFMQQEFKKIFGGYANDIRYRLKAARGSMSGGTIDSMMNIIDTVKADPSSRNILGNPYALNPDPKKNGPDGRDQNAAAYDDKYGAWTTPFIMAGINTRIVRRSNAIMDFPWGKDFSYTEAVSAGKGIKGWLRAKFISAGLKAFMFAATIEITRTMMFRLFLPKPGEGPNAEQRRDGFFNIAFVATDSAGNTLHGKVAGDRDPGYGATSRMLGETAVCLARDMDMSLPGEFWTPAASIGPQLIRRLSDNAGIEFSVTATSERESCQTR